MDNLEYVVFYTKFDGVNAMALRKFKKESAAIAYGRRIMKQFVASGRCTRGTLASGGFGRHVYVYASEFAHKFGEPPTHVIFLDAQYV